MKKILSITLILLFISLQINARSQYEPTHWESPSKTALTPSVLVDPLIEWPKWGWFQDTEEIHAVFSSMGTFGDMGGYIGQFRALNFESPNGSSIEYLYNGGIWVGGIIGEDTLVSVALDGWNFVHELWPRDLHKGGTTGIDSISDFGFRSLFSDTLTNSDYVEPEPWSGRYHHPLNLRLSNRSYIFNTDPYDKGVIYDLVITNIGEESIEAGYAGFFFDCDVFYSDIMSTPDFTEDISGSFQDRATAYSIDLNGNPVDSAFNEKSPIRAFGLKILNTSFNNPDINFNWWKSNGNPQLDFGPRQKGTPEDDFRDFGGFIGTPEGDENKYYIMSHKEWDYDQILTATIDSTDSIWLFPDSALANDIADGGDTRFLMSIGPFNLEPDSSVRIIYTTFVGENIHVDPTNGDSFDPDNPDIYYNNLDFTDFHATGDALGEIFDTLLNSSLPVVGLDQIYRNRDTLDIEWDPWVFDDIDGFDIYLTEIEDYGPFPGVVAPWIGPDQPVLHEQINRDYKYSFNAIDSLTNYFINVTNRIDGQSQRYGKPLISVPSSYGPAPEIVGNYYYSPIGQDSIKMEWLAPLNFDVDHYQIFKISKDSIFIQYHPFYSSSSYRSPSYAKDSVVVDGFMYYYHAMTPYAAVNGEKLEFTDYSANNGDKYFIVAVNADGFESDFSGSIEFISTPEKNRDILIIIDYCRYRVSGIEDVQIAAHYDSILSGTEYDYEFYYMADSSKPEDIYNPIDSLLDRMLHYMTIIVEGGISGTSSMAIYHMYHNDIAKYLHSSGGKIVWSTSINEFFYNHIIFNLRPAENEFLYKYLGIDSIYTVAHPAYFFDSAGELTALDDSLLGFCKAESMDALLSDLYYDSIPSPFSSIFTGLYPPTTAPGVQAYKINDRAEPLYRYKSLYPETSLLEDEIVGLKTIADDYTTYLFGFHLWYMEYSQARDLINQVTGNTMTDLTDNKNYLFPNRIMLGQNYPNPFNMSTDISFDLPRKADVQITVYNILGRRVADLLNKSLPAGHHSISWDGFDNNGDELSSGIYFYRMETDNFRAVKKMILLK